MKTTTTYLITAALLAAVLVFTGCASGNTFKRGAKASSGMQDAGREIEALAAQTDATLAALSDLVLNPGPDLVAQFRTYERAVNRLSSQTDRAMARTERMRRDAQAYFQEWQAGTQDIANPEIRARSERRRLEVAEAFEKVDASLRRVKDDYTPFLSDLTDIRRALSSDLTLGGVKAMTSITERAMPRGAKLKESLRIAAADAHDLAAKLAPTGP